MAERTLPGGMVTYIKYKYTRPKSRGTYKGGGGQNATRSKRKKNGPKGGQRVAMMVVTETGRIRWE